MNFRIGPQAAEMTTMEAAEARKHDLPIPRKPVPGLTFKGQEVRASRADPGSMPSDHATRANTR